MSEYPYECPTCGKQVIATAKYAARQRASCRACVRAMTGWTCQTCGTSDPHHPSPCPEDTK